MKIKLIYLMIILLISFSVFAAPFRVDENIEMGTNDIYNVTNVNASYFYGDLVGGWTPSGNVDMLTNDITNAGTIGGVTLIGSLDGSYIENMDINCGSDTFFTGINFTDESATCTAISDVYLSNSGDTGTGVYIFTGGTFDTDTLNTGQGDYELYAMNQNVESTDDVTFNNTDSYVMNSDKYCIGIDCIDAWSDVNTTYTNTTPIGFLNDLFYLVPCPDLQVYAYNVSYGGWQCQPKLSSGGVTSVSGDGSYVIGTITSTGSFTFNEGKMNQTIDALDSGNYFIDGSTYIYPNGSYSDNVKIEGNLNVTGTTNVTGTLRSYGNVFIDDIGGSTHHINVDLENLDELYANVFLTPLQINTSYNASGSYVNILAEQGESSITVNIGNSTGANNYRLQYNNLSLQLTPGTNESPILNRVYVYLNAGVPTWTVSTTEPTVKHAMVARILLGAVDEDPVAASLQEDGQVGHLKRTQRRFRKEGLLYEDGFDYNATSTDLSIGLGGYINGVYDLDTTTIPTVTGGFYQVLNNGSYVYYDSFDDIVEYSDGNTIGTNKYFNVVFGITPYDSTGRIYAVVQSKPATEYTSMISAYSDSSSTVAVYPSEDFLKITFLPIARMIINEGDDAQVLPSGLYAIDYRGGLAGGVASGGGLTETDPVWTVDKPSYVPYTGATTDLDLGAHNLKVASINASGTVYSGAHYVNGVLYFGTVGATPRIQLSGDALYFTNNVGNQMIYNTASALSGVGTLDTGQGANELYDMDQNVLTTSDVIFNDLNVSNVSIGNSKLVPQSNWLTVNGDSTGGNVWFYREGVNSSGLNFGMNHANGIAAISSLDSGNDFKKLNLQGSSISLNIDTTPAILINSSLGTDFYGDISVDGLVYANDDIKFTDGDESINNVKSIVGRSSGELILDSSVGNNILLRTPNLAGTTTNRLRILGGVDTSEIQITNSDINVTGNLNIDGDYEALKLSRSGGVGSVLISLEQGNGSQSGIEYTTANELKLENPKGTTRINIEDNGYVGIGTSAPTSILDINGNLSVNNKNMIGCNSTCCTIMSPDGTGNWNVCNTP